MIKIIIDFIVCCLLLTLKAPTWCFVLMGVLINLHLRHIVWRKKIGEDNENTGKRNS